MNSTFDSENSSNTVANNLSLAATVLAAGAFIVAFAQALLEYFSSSDARNKVTYQAIGDSALQVKFGWKLRFWKLGVKYPLLNLGFDELFELALAEEKKHIDAYPEPTYYMVKEHNWGFRSVEETDVLRFNDFADSYTKVVDRGSWRVITTKDLTWKECFVLWRWKLQHYSSEAVTRPRASWALLLAAMSIRNTKTLTYKHADADVIPSSVDVPIQRIRLYDLGRLCFALGFRKVSLSPEERFFEASGDYGTVTTMFKADLGKVLRFEGDSLLIYAKSSSGGLSDLWEHTGITIGKFLFGPIWTSVNGYRSPLAHLPRAIKNGWNTTEFKEEQTKEMEGGEGSGLGLVKGEFAAEASLFRELYRNRALILKQTRNRPSEKTPSKSSPERRFPDAGGNHDVDDESAGTKPFGRTSTGLSTNDFYKVSDEDHDTEGNVDSVESLEQVLSKWQRATSLTVPTLLPTTAIAALGPVTLGFPVRLIVAPILSWVRLLSPLVLERSRPHIYTSNYLQTLLLADKVNYFRANQEFWIAYNFTGLDFEGRMGWMFKDIKEIYDESQKELQDEMILRDEDGKLTGEIQIVMFPDSVTLLQNYDPENWAGKISSIVALSVHAFKPRNILWAQIGIFDLLIHYLLRKSRWYEGHDEGYEMWTDENLEVVKAVIRSWDGKWSDSSPRASLNLEKEADNNGQARMSAEKIRDEPEDVGIKKLARRRTSKMGQSWSPLAKSTGVSFPSAPAPLGPPVGRNSFPSTNPVTNIKSPLPEADSNPVPRASEEQPPASPIKHVADTSSETETHGEDISLTPLAAASLPKLKTLGNPFTKKPRLPSLEEPDVPYVDTAPTSDWDLLTHLKSSSLELDDDPDTQQLKLEQLACLLQLRSLFYVALLALNPDSSDVFLAQKSTVTMPMI